MEYLHILCVVTESASDLPQVVHDQCPASRARDANSTSTGIILHLILWAKRRSHQITAALLQ